MFIITYLLIGAALALYSQPQVERLATENNKHVITALIVAFWLPMVMQIVIMRSKKDND